MTAEVPHLKLQGAVADAIALWSCAFPDLQIPMLDPGPPARASIFIADQLVALSEGQQADDTPTTALTVTCEAGADVDRIAAILGEGGRVVIPLHAYPFAPRYTWLIDRFGVSWQISLKAAVEEK